MISIFLIYSLSLVFLIIFFTTRRRRGKEGKEKYDERDLEFLDEKNIRQNNRNIRKSPLNLMEKKTEKETKKNLKHNNLKVAVCYFEIIRSIKKICQSYFTHLYDILRDNNFEYNIYLHTWKTYNNKAYVWDQRVNTELDYNEYRLLSPPTNTLSTIKMYSLKKMFYPTFQGFISQAKGSNRKNCAAD